MSSTDDLKGRFYKFREKKYALPAALLLTFVVCSLLLMYSAALCFGSLAAAIIAYYVPYYFGLKDRKKLAVWGLVLLIAISIPYGVKLVSDYQSFEGETVRSDTGKLYDGKVTPFNAVDTRTHNFTVTVNNSIITPEITEAHVVINNYWLNRNFNSPDLNRTMQSMALPNGDRQFYWEGQLPEQALYAFRFTAFDNTTWYTTEITIGPIDLTSGTLYQNVIWGTIMSTLFSVGILFYLLLFMTWFTDRSKKRAAELQQSPGAPPSGGSKASEAKGNEENFVCSECGAGVPADARSCPQCGEGFEEEGAPSAAGAKEDEYYCTDCGATVKGSDTVCPNCKKKFED